MRDQDKGESLSAFVTLNGRQRPLPGSEKCGFEEMMHCNVEMMKSFHNLCGCVSERAPTKRKGVEGEEK